jgi:predicted nucleotidyltransferase
MAFGIICEYNPFHNGHLRQINEIKKESDEPIVCVMSGNFTQRGEVAIADKYARAQMAIEAGADLVLELPVPFCMASAEYFASAGIYILNELGVDKISFGSESADAKKIMKIAEIAASDEFKEECARLSKSEGSASAYFDLLAEKSGVDGIKSNDILAIEYAKAIIKNKYLMKICPIKREGNAYRDVELVEGELPSASAIRESIFNDRFDEIERFVPSSTLDILKSNELANICNIDSGVLLALRLADIEKLDVAISDKGLVNRIISLSHNSPSLKYLIENIQTKKYTSAAIRRAILYILLGIKQSDLDNAPTYTTLLGANEKGRAYLSSIRKDERNIKIVTKPADADECRQLEIDKKADALYSMCFKHKKRSEFCVRKSPYIE